MAVDRTLGPIHPDPGGSAASDPLSRPAGSGVLHRPDPPIYVPPGLVVDVAPPPELAEKLRDIEKWALCGGRSTIDWPKATPAPWAGKRLTLFCAEPLCIETGACTGPRFVPHLDQFTRDPEDSRAQRRKIMPEEAIAGAKAAARKQLGKDDPRKDQEIARHIGRTWKRMMEGLRGRRF